MTTATATWVNREATAEELIPLIGKLHRENGVVLSFTAAAWSTSLSLSC